MKTFKTNFTQNTRVDCEKLNTKFGLFIEFIAWVQVDTSSLLKFTLNLLKEPPTYFTP